MDLISDNSRLSSRDLGTLVNVDHTTILTILHEDLKLKNVCSVWVPTELSAKNKEDRVNCAKRIIDHLSQHGSLNYCVEDELWVDHKIETRK